MSNEPEEILEATTQPEGDVVERINKADIKPLFDTNHEHVFVPDPSDQTDDYSVEMCSVEGCGLGRAVAR